MVWEGLSDQRTSEQTPEGNEDAIHGAIWEKTLSGREMSKCNSPEAGTWVECPRKVKKANVAGVKWARGQGERMM